jgi:biotin synthase
MHSWSRLIDFDNVSRREEIDEIYNRPLIELLYDAATVHRMHHNPREVQQATLLSIKTGGCVETCSYCAQSSSWSKDTGLQAEKLMDLDDVYKAALDAHASGSTRFCMGAAWRGPSQVGPKQFERVLDMVSKVRALGMEVCTTLGMLTAEQSHQLKTAGLTCYNHNLDTSPEFYPKITSSRTYDDRLDTIGKVREAGISVCSGGIIGMGELDKDRVGLIHTLATLPEHPESVPINALVPVEGTPLEMKGVQQPTGLEMVRCVATARIAMPRAMVRLSAGRLGLSTSEQGMCFFAGANSIFAGDKLLTTANNERSADAEMFDLLGLVNKPAFNGKQVPFEIPNPRRESIKLREEWKAAKMELGCKKAASASA